PPGRPRPRARSGDGSEAWAVRPASVDNVMGDPTLYHYVPSDWTRCDIGGVAGVVPADPACATLAPLLHYFAGYDRHPVQLQALGRIPTEVGSDRAQAGDFQVEAITSEYHTASRPAILRYAHGRWSFDDDA